MPVTHARMEDARWARKGIFVTAWKVSRGKIAMKRLIIVRVILVKMVRAKAGELILSASVIQVTAVKNAMKR